MDEYVSREAVFQVVHGIARGIADRDTEALKAKNMKAFYMVKGAKEILDSVDTDLCYIQAADVQPVKHGEWLKVSWNNYKCSLCNNQYVGMGAITFTYCPNCGANMRGDIE
jgi:hypothetical protein